VGALPTLEWLFLSNNPLHKRKQLLRSLSDAHPARHVRI